jgi:hypothetical protein
VSQRYAHSGGADLGLSGGGTRHCRNSAGVSRSHPFERVSVKIYFCGFGLRHYPGGGFGWFNPTPVGLVSPEQLFLVEMLATLRALFLSVARAFWAWESFLASPRFGRIAGCRLSANGR